MKTFNFRRLRIQSAMTVALLVACVLVTGNCSPVTAQVAIGGDGTVTPGALLDLSQATDAGGLLLPQIESADTATAVLKKPGMLVYNKTDGKIYAYNGSAWSAGGSSGGGGGGDDPDPAPSSCTGVVMGASGTVYPIGSYPDAQSGLKNLCWTLANLKEDGYYFTKYDNQADSGGYWYWDGELGFKLSNDVCTRTIGSAWRIINLSDWELLRDGWPSLSVNEKQAWCCMPANMQGGMIYSSGCWCSSWAGAGVKTFMYVVGSTYNRHSVAIYDKDMNMDRADYYGLAATIRCVRDI
ncbi:MAG: hypothetical protein LBN93_09315 [Candidatus Symbiothrix sp.]|jgi:hypothetical protein|nr:hypothetical protein [Candidatus Symbiothrix sp.]